MKAYLARIVVHFTAKVEAEEGQQDQAAADLGEAIGDSLEAALDCIEVSPGTASISAGVMETLIEGEA